MRGDISLETIISYAKRRGFIFPSSDIYGGFRSSYDYGPLGVELKNAVKRLWWEAMVARRNDIVGVDAAILMSPCVWEASGHTSAGFADELAECPKCHKRYRADHVGGKCPDCGVLLGETRKFNLLVRTNLGPVEDDSTLAYLRPETAQGIFVNFAAIAESMRMKLPFGIAQIGKAFRNEITPGPFTFRMREFEQMEMQWFYDPEKPSGREREWFAYWKDERKRWYSAVLGISDKHLRLQPHERSALAHYAKDAADIEYAYPWGWDEFEGIHMRGDWDLSQHERQSGQKLRIFDEEANEHVLPHVVETSGGVDRATLVVLLEHYDEEELRGPSTRLGTGPSTEKRIVLRLPPHLAPVPVAVLPIVRNDDQAVRKAQEIASSLQPFMRTMYDETGTIGRRYRRLDEIGTPFAVTVDRQTFEDETVTVRERDSMRQQRLAVVELRDFLSEKLAAPAFLAGKFPR